MSDDIIDILTGIDLNEIQKELYKKSFYEFSLDAFKALHNGSELIPNWHIKYLCDRLQKN